MIAASFDWTPVGMLLSFVVGISGTVVAFIKGRKESGAKEKADAALNASNMVTLAFRTLEAQAATAIEDHRQCRFRCDALEAENRDLHAENRANKAEIRELREQVRELQVEVNELRGTT